MTYDELAPKNITDIVFRLEDYIDFMRSTQTENVLPFIENVEEYIIHYFDTERVDIAKLKKEMVEMVNELYLATMNIDVRDTYTDAYFGTVLALLFEEINQMNVRIFFIVNNSLTDERFLLFIELFQLMGCNTVTPYEDSDIDPVPEITRVPARHYDDVKSDILYGLEQGKHIVYVEKDRSVSYIQRVLDIAEQEQREYQCLYRNKPVTHEKALWLRGQFKEIV